MACIRTEELSIRCQCQRVGRRELFAEADIIAHTVEILVDRLERVNKSFKVFAVLGRNSEVQAYHTLTITGIERSFDEMLLCRSTRGFLIVMEEK